MNVIQDPELRAFIHRLHEESSGQDEEVYGYFIARLEGGDTALDRFDADTHRFFADKLVALDADKAALCHQLCVALGARTVVEVGTSHGVSTLYLADALRANGGGRVIATEYEPAKAAAARENFRQAGLDSLIDLREGDLRETLKEIEGPVDFVLMDIWIEMAVPAMELLLPHLRPGGVVICDNTEAFREAYRPYLTFIEENGFSTQTLPFEGGLELSVKRK